MSSIEQQVQRALDELYRTGSRRIFATLVRLIGDFDLAEEALHEAFTAAIETWPRDGIPAKPQAWLVSTGRFKVIDVIRRRARFKDFVPALTQRLENQSPVDDLDEAAFKDDLLRLIFTCCHPALAPEARVTLTLREVCGLTTEEIASAFLTNVPTLAQRIVRAKSKIRDANIPYETPAPEQLAERLQAVLQVIYLVFNEGYYASSGEAHTRPELSALAIRLGRTLLELMPEPEVIGLLALMLLHESRRAARTTPGGDVILLEDQNRALWNRAFIDEGVQLVEQALRSQRFGPYTVQAAIAAVHAESSTPEATDWGQIVGLYDVLLRLTPSPVIELNRAVAVAMHEGPEAGLVLVDAVLARGELAEYHHAHGVRGELCRRIGKVAEAKESYERALALARQEPERRLIRKRLAELA